MATVTGIKCGFHMTVLIAKLFFLSLFIFVVVVAVVVVVVLLLLLLVLFQMIGSSERSF